MNWENYLFYIAPLIGVCTLFIGIAAVTKPQAMSKKFGIAVKGIALPYVIATGIRDVFIGLTILILFNEQNWKTLSYIHFAIGIVAISDFCVVQRHGNKNTSLVHAFGAIAVIAYGVWLLSFS